MVLSTEAPTANDAISYGKYNHEENDLVRPNFTIPSHAVLKIKII